MRVYQIAEIGQPAILANLTQPEIGEGDVFIEIKACGLNFADILMAAGKYQDTPSVPFTLGMEVAGIVSKVGTDVAHLRAGQRVAVFGGQGGLADFGVFPAKRCVAMPDAMSFEDAAALQIAYGTSHVALDYKAQLKPGETLVVTGAAGGVGLTAVEIGKKMGAKVIAIARGTDKLAVAQRAGADHLLDADHPDLRSAVKALGGADVVYDAVGGDLFKSVFRACNPEARILTIGFASGTVPQIPANHLLVKNISVIGFYWGGYLKFKPNVITDSLKTLMTWHSAGDISPHISHVLPLDRAGEGLDLLKSRKSTGKIIITP